MAKLISNTRAHIFQIPTKEYLSEIDEAYGYSDYVKYYLFNDKYNIPILEQFYYGGKESFDEMPSFDVEEDEIPKFRSYMFDIDSIASPGITLKNKRLSKYCKIFITIYNSREPDEYSYVHVFLFDDNSYKLIRKTGVPPYRLPPDDGTEYEIKLLSLDELKNVNTIHDVVGFKDNSVICYFPVGENTVESCNSEDRVSGSSCNSFDDQFSESSCDSEDPYNNQVSELSCKSGDNTPNNCFTRSRDNSEENILDDKSPKHIYDSEGSIDNIFSKYNCDSYEMLLSSSDDGFIRDYIEKYNILCFNRGYDYNANNPDDYNVILLSD